MPYALYVSAEGAQAQARRMEVIANNLANVDTVGFKRDLAVMRARFAAAIEEGDAIAGDGSINDVGGGVELAGTRTEFSQGPLKRTNQPTDLALENDGFFVVRRGNKNLLTRSGNFDINAGGYMVTDSGDFVLGEDGDPVAIEPDRGPWQIDDTGILQQGDTKIPLAMVRPKSMGDLIKLGDNLYQPLASVRPVPAEERAVTAGFYEASNVRPTTEMIDMIEASRAFEANVNLIRQNDQLLGSLVNRVLTVR